MTKEWEMEEEIRRPNLVCPFSSLALFFRLHDGGPGLAWRSTTNRRVEKDGDRTEKPSRHFKNYVRFDC